MLLDVRLPVSTLKAVAAATHASSSPPVAPIPASLPPTRAPLPARTPTTGTSLPWQSDAANYCSLGSTDGYSPPVAAARLPLLWARSPASYHCRTESNHLAVDGIEGTTTRRATRYRTTDPPPRVGNLPVMNSGVDRARATRTTARPCAAVRVAALGVTAPPRSKSICPYASSASCSAAVLAS